MQHESNENRLTITDSSITFDTVLEKPYAPVDVLDELKEANLLIIPNENSGRSNDPVFPETTLDFYEYLKDNAPEVIKPEILASDDDFKILELHSAVLIVASFIVTSVMLPIAVNLVSSYIYDKAKKYHRNNEDLNAEVNIIAEKKKGKKSIKISYKGPASGVEGALNMAVKQISESKDE